MRVFIIAGTGVTGKTLVEKYGREGHLVIAVSRQIPDEVPLGKIIYRKWDGEQIPGLNEALGNLTYDLVIDCDGFGGEEIYRERLRILKSRCRQYVMLLSEIIYSDYEWKHLLLREKMVYEEFAGEEDCFYTVIRAGVVYGEDLLPIAPYQARTMTKGLLKKILWGKSVFISDGLEEKYPIMHVSDFADKLYQLLQKEESRNRNFRVIGKELITSEEVLQEIADQWGVNIRTAYIPIPLGKQAGVTAQNDNHKIQSIDCQVENSGNFREYMPELLDSCLYTLSQGFLDNMEQDDYAVWELKKRVEIKERIIWCREMPETPVSGKLINFVYGRGFDVRRNEKKFQILVDWMEIRQNKGSLIAFFEQRKIHSLAIYGMGEIGQLLYKELRKEKPGLISYVIDKGGHGTMDSIPVFYYFAPNLPKVDAVVVTPVLLGKDEIERIAETAKGEIYTLEEIITALR